MYIYVYIYIYIYIYVYIYVYICIYIYICVCVSYLNSSTSMLSFFLWTSSKISQIHAIATNHPLISSPKHKMYRPWREGGMLEVPH